MTREELAEKTKKNLSEIAKSLGVKGASKLTRDELIEHILLLNPPFSANSESAVDISHHLENAWKEINPEHLSPPTETEDYGSRSMADMTDEQDIPFSYNDTRIVLLIRDPYWLYSYWDINHETKTNLTKEWGDFYHLPLMLRIYDVTDIHFDGKNSHHYFDIPIQHHSTNWYIHVGIANRSFCVDLGFLQSNGDFYTIARSNVVTTPRDRSSEIVDEEWMIIEEDFKRLYRLAGMTAAGNSSAELVEALLMRLEREMGSAAVSSLSSPIKYQPRERNFWFVLDTELIVHGATVPGSQVTIQGEPVELRPDGTFSLRFALPDGIRDLPAIAQSADGIDTIAIHPVITRKTN